MAGIVTSWSYDGTALANNAWKVIDFADDLPKRTGGNVALPSRYGTLPTRKYFDERRVTLFMGVEDLDQSSGTTRTAAQMLANIQALKLLFGKPGRHTLSKVLADGTTQTIQAEVEGQVKFDIHGPHVYKFSVVLACSTPFWEPASASTDTEAVTADLQTWTIDAGGTAPVVDATITIDVQATDPRITNTTTDQYIEYNGTIGASDTLVINCGTQTATLNGTTDVSDEIIHGVPDGDLPISFWWEFLAGSNGLKFSADTFTASGDVKFDWTAKYW